MHNWPCGGAASPQHDKHVPRQQGPYWLNKCNGQYVSCTAGPWVPAHACCPRGRHQLQSLLRLQLQVLPHEAPSPAYSINQDGQLISGPAAACI